MTITIGSAFSGIGAWEKALTDLSIPHELQWFFEVDPYASVAYSAIHGTPASLNHKDITEVNPDLLSDIDLFVYSPPCQAFSKAGKQQGFLDTRGVLFFDALKIIQAKKPKVALMENVVGLTEKKFKREFRAMLDALSEAGYYNYWRVLNSKDYGIPQHRERVFIVSLRKDVDFGLFTFPPPFGCELRLKDLLEPEVDILYYVDPERCEGMTFLDVEPANDLLFVGGIGVKKWLDDGKDFSRNYPQGNRVYSSLGIACSQTAQGGGLGSYTGLYLVEPTPLTPYPVRKLTPLESWRVMGFKDDDFFKAQAALNNTFYGGKDMSKGHLYKMAGNSIVVDTVKVILSAVLDYL